jgi:glycosyltransferase involved in cell wall biosynthesis
LRLASEWAARGQDVRVAMGRDSGPQFYHAPDNLTSDFARPSRLAAPFETLWMVFHLIGAIRRHRPDVLFCAGSTYTIVAILVRLWLGSSCPPTVCKLSNSLERRDLPPLARAAFGLWLRLHARFIECFVGMAEPMREEIERCLGVDGTRIEIIADPAIKAAELELLAKTERQPSELRRFVAIGRMTAQKNFRLLLEAFAAFAGPDDRLLIAGDGRQRARLIDLAHRLGIAERVSMPGHVHSVAEAFAGTDVFVMSSDYEGVPAVVIEALAAGVPIVATDCSVSMSYLLEGGAFGTLVPIGDAAALAAAMRGAPARDAIPIEAMRAKAAQFTIERSAGLYLDALRAEARSAIRSSGSSSPIWSRTSLEAGGADTVR